MASGRVVIAPLASTSSVLAQQSPSAVIDNSFLRLSGSSMASAVVSGAAALIFQAHPTWTNDQAKSVLTSTSRQLGTVSGWTFTPYVGQGAGEIDALASTSYCGTPSYANQGLTISGCLIGPNGTTIYANVSSSWTTSSWTSSGGTVGMDNGVNVVKVTNSVLPVRPGDGVMSTVGKRARPSRLASVVLALSSRYKARFY